VYTYNAGLIACARTNEEYISFSARRVASTPQRSPAFRVKANVANRSVGSCSPSRFEFASTRCRCERARPKMHGFSSEDTALGVRRAESARRRDDSFVHILPAHRVRNHPARQTTAITTHHLTTLLRTRRFELVCDVTSSAIALPKKSRAPRARFNVVSSRKIFASALRARARPRRRESLARETNGGARDR